MSSIFKATIAYDGTSYCGWQQQPTRKAIANVLEATFIKIFKADVSIVGASRTDSGVHALGQVARIKTILSLNALNVMEALNNQLPKDIYIREMQEVQPSFHPQAQVKEKTYWYVIFLKKPLPMLAKYGWHYGFIDQVDLYKFEQVLAFYKGTHDFGSFCKVEQDKTTVRTITNISLRSLRHFGAVLVEIRGLSFLHFQIRRMIGYALDATRQEKFPEQVILHLLKNPHSQQKLLKAEASGLCLRRILYEVQ